jgi:hypothetical protein
MSKRPTPQEIRDHYRPNVEALSTSDLLRMADSEGFSKVTPKYIRTELVSLAIDECTSRGITFRSFARAFGGY